MTSSQLAAGHKCILYLRSVQVYLGLWQCWGLKNLQKEAHHLPHIVLEALEACSTGAQLVTVVDHGRDVMHRSRRPKCCR